jgi:hypothetical protein
MEDYFDPDRIAALLQATVDWLLLNVSNLWALLQIGLLAALCAGLLMKHSEHRSFRHRSAPSCGLKCMLARTIRGVLSNPREGGFPGL